MLKYYCPIFQNAYFYQSRTILNKARELAAKKDIKALEELSHSEVCSASVCRCQEHHLKLIFWLYFNVFDLFLIRLTILCPAGAVTRLLGMIMRKEFCHH
jgi:hypothetical protein